MQQYILPIIGVVILLLYFALKKEKDDSSSGLMNKAKNSFRKRSTGTPTLDIYTIDFTARAKSGDLNPVIGRDAEIIRLTQILSRKTKNNAILVGDPGVGKTAIAEGVAYKIAKGEITAQLANKRVLSLDVSGMLAGTKYRGEFEERAKKLVQEITNANRTIILFIDEMHSIIQSHGSEGSVNFADILKPALARGELQLIGATTIDEYNKYIKTDPSLERRFQPINIVEPTREQTIAILQGIKNNYRQYHKVEFTDGAISAAAILTQKNVSDRKLPDKAIDAIDEAAAMVKVSNLSHILPLLLDTIAADVRPEATKVWAEIQRLDKGKKVNQKKIEKLEEELAHLGIVTVDSDDIKRVVSNWSHVF